MKKLRFDGFTDKWEDKKLNDITKYESSNITLGKIKYKENGFILYDARGQVSKINEYKQEEKYISILKDGSGVGRIKLHEEKSSLISTMGYIISKENLLFTYYRIKQIDFKTYVTGSTIPHLYYNDYKNVNVRVPVIEEQKKIGDFLHNYDNLISLKKEELELLEYLKKETEKNIFHIK